MDRNEENFKIVLETRAVTKSEMILDLLFYGLPEDLIFDVFKDDDKVADRQLRQIIDTEMQEVMDWKREHPGVLLPFEKWVKNI